MMMLEFIQTLNEGARIDHPEDLIFSDGSNGARQALSALKEVPAKTNDLTIKWDGFPALVFGRNADGQLVVADKHMFTKKDGSGRVTSVKDFVQYDVNRGANRGDLYQKLQILWPAFEQAVPKTSKGYYWGDLLWTGKLTPQRDHYQFTPNTVTYTVAVQSDLGRRISKSVGGIVVHQFFPDFDVEPQILKGTGELKLDGPLCILTPNMPDQITLKEPVQLVKSAEKAINSYGPAVDKMLDITTLTNLKIKDLGALLQKYINARVRGETRSFIDWLPGNVTENKLKMLVGSDNEGYLYQHAAGLNGTLSIFQTILNIKDDYIKQLDSQQKTVHARIGNQLGGEGYVFATSQGLIKLVNRATFSAANFARNP
jgi:hypothetical protein